MRGFNWAEVNLDAINDNERILLVYAAQNYGENLGRNQGAVLNKLHITNVRITLWPAFFRTKYSVKSNYKTVKQYSFVNPKALEYPLPVEAKIAYMKLAMLLTTEQRWYHVLYGNSLEIPLEVVTEIDSRIPNKWIEISNTKLKMQMEENYYGNNKRLGSSKT